MELFLLISTAVIILCLKALYPRWQLYRWRRQWAGKERLFQRLYADIDGFQLSKQAKGDDSDPALVYGEIDFFALIAALSLVHPEPSDVFYDLGAGSGKAVIAAALSYPMQAYHGIELLLPLHQGSTEVKKNLALEPAMDVVATQIHFTHGDILQQDISDADIVFINATGFFSPLWDHMVTHLKQLKAGTRLLVTSKSLPVDSFELQHETQMMMSWGACGLRVYHRVLDEQ